MEEQTKQQLQEIKQKEIPSLVIAGANDTVLPLEIAQEQRDLLGADFVIMKTGHTPHIEDKNGFVQYIIQWIKKNNI